MGPRKHLGRSAHKVVVATQGHSGSAWACLSQYADHFVAFVADGAADMITTCPWAMDFKPSGCHAQHDAISAERHDRLIWHDDVEVPTGNSSFSW